MRRPIALLAPIVSIAWCLVGAVPHAGAADPPAAAPPPAYPPAVLAELKKIRDASMQSDYGWKVLAHLTGNIGPRLSGSPQAEEANRYLAAELKRLGLVVALQDVKVPHWVRGPESAELLAWPGMAPGTTHKVVVTALGGSIATPPEGMTADVVVARDADELEALGRKKVEGKIVVWNKAYDQRLADAGLAGPAYGQAVKYRGAGPILAGKLGAVASLNRAAGGAIYRVPHTGATDYAPDVAKIPAASLTAEDAELVAQLAAQGPVKMHLVLGPQTLPDVASHNVLGDLRGSASPDEVVVIGGHLDSWDLGTGALDDGAGVAMAMQVAQVLQQLKLRPRRTIRVVPFMNEENGLRGGVRYAEEYGTQRHVAGIEADIGCGHALGFEGRVGPGGEAWLAPVAKILEDLGAGVSRPTEGSPADVSPLGRAGPGSGSST